MKEYVAIVKHENSVSVCLYVEKDKIMTLGEKMNELNDEAYMNGYNWEAFFNHYLSKYEPAILENMESDPEAGMYVAFYELTQENEKKAEKFCQIIEHLIENENGILEIIKREGEDIDWD